MATVTKPLALDESLNSTENTPRNIADVLADELDGIKQAINGQSGSGNGHIIQNSSGANMPSENTMQFVDAHLSDDSVGGKTKVETFKAVTEAEYSSETEDGAYIITDGDGAVIEPASDDYVEVTADGEKTYATLLSELWSGIDVNKITVKSILQIHRTVFMMRYLTDTLVAFSEFDIGVSSLEGMTVVLSSLSGYPTYDTFTNGTKSSLLTNKPTSGRKITLYYGNKKAVVDLQTTAGRCWLNNGKTVQEAINELMPIRYSLTLINGWTGSVDVEFTNSGRITSIGGVLNGANATSDIFADASVDLSDCITNHKLPVSIQATEILANLSNTIKIAFVYADSAWTAQCAIRTGAFAMNSIYNNVW